MIQPHRAWSTSFTWAEVQMGTKLRRQVLNICSLECNEVKTKRSEATKSRQHRGQSRNLTSTRCSKQTWIKHSSETSKKTIGWQENRHFRSLSKAWKQLKAPPPHLFYRLLFSLALRPEGGRHGCSRASLQNFFGASGYIQLVVVRFWMDTQLQVQD